MPPQRGRLGELLADVHFEVIPLAGALEKAAVLPEGSTVTVTASPRRGLGATIELAAGLSRLGYRAVPHLAARMIRDAGQLRQIVETLLEGGVREIFVVGGDPEPLGAYPDAISLLHDLAGMGRPFVEVGIAGYPEGHPHIDDDRLLEALLQKADHAGYLTTQLCFDPRALLGWVEAIRAEGVQLPVRVGVAGAVEALRLLRISARIGVGASMKFLSTDAGMLRLLRPGGYVPDRIVEAVARADRNLGLSGLHVFTFNQVSSTLAWRDARLDELLRAP